MIYMRGQARDYDGWARARRPGLVLGRRACRYFLRHEDHWRDEGADAVHAAPGPTRAARRAGGEWRVEKQRLSLGHPRRVRARPREQAGIPQTDDFNRGDNDGVGYFEVNQRARRALERDQGVPAAGAEARATCRC